MKILAADGKIRCVHSSRQTSCHKHYFFVRRRIAWNEFENQHSSFFLTMKSAVEPNRLLMKFLLCHLDIQEKKNFLGITWESKRSWRRPYLMTLYVIFPIHVNFPISSKCVLKATVHRKKNSQLFYITWEVFLFIKRCFYDTVHACCIWLIIPFHHYHLSIIFVI